MYDLAPPQTSFINDIFFDGDAKHAEREKLGYDPDYKAHILSIIRSQAIQPEWSPSEHFRILHQQPRGELPRHKSAVLIANTIAPNGKHKTLLKRYFNKSDDRFFEATEALLDEMFDGATDTYFNQNGFSNWRTRGQTAYCGAHFLDCDLEHIPADRRSNKNDYVAEVIARIVYAGLIAPSYVMNSGRGFNMVWLTDYRIMHNANREKVSRIWQSRQDALLRVFKGLGIPFDTSVKDITRIFRFAGSVNSKSGQRVQPIFVQGDKSNPSFTSCSEFYNSCRDALNEGHTPIDIQPPTPAQAVALVPELSVGIVPDAKPQKPSQPHNAGSKSITSWGDIVHADMLKIIEHRYNNVIPESWRDKFVFLATAVKIATLDLSEVHIEMQLHQNDEVLEVFNKFADFTDIENEQLFKNMSSAFARLNRARSGEKSVTNGNQDVRYTYKRDTLVSMLEVSKDEMDTLNLRALIDNDTRLKRRREEKAESRGQISPAMSKSERDAERHERHSAIAATWTINRNIKQTARQFKCSKNTVKAALRNRGLL